MMNNPLLILLLDLGVCSEPRFILEYAQIKQKYQKWIIHRKLRVPTSERQGKLSNPRGRTARAAWRKFTEIYGIPRAHLARVLCSDFLPFRGTVEP